MPTPHHCRPALRLLVGACLFGGAIGEAQEGPLVTVETVDDELFGLLRGLNHQHGVLLAGDSNARIRSEDVLALRFEKTRQAAEAPDNAGVVTLDDGSRFSYRSVDFLGERVRFLLPGDAVHEARTDRLAEWRIAAESPADLEVSDPGEAADFLFVRRANGETVPVSGVVLELNDQGVRFALDANDTADPVAAPWSRIAGVRFYRAPRAAPSPAVAVIDLNSGATIVAESVAYQRDRLEWRSGGGRGECPIAAVASIDLSGGRVIPVRRLELLSQRWKPYFENVESTGKDYAFDGSLVGGPLALRWPDRRASAAWPAVNTVRPYENGVAIRSDGELRFVLPEGSRRLKGWIGLDPRTAGVGSAEVSVVAGEKVLWSGVVDGGTRPVELNAELPAARALSLRVGYGDNLDAGDNVHFAELRVVR